MNKSILVAMLVALGLGFNACGGGGGDEIAPTSITHNGVTYKTVTSPYTGKVWLDRNLGASQVCTDLNDTACYGDYYQWGRESDGHEDNESITTVALANILPVDHGNFIVNSSSPSDWAAVGVDDNGSLRSANWSKTDGSSVCPVGFRVPTIAELLAETTQASTPVTDRDDAYANFLKLPSAGLRLFSSGSVYRPGSYGIVWSSSVSGSDSRYLDFDSSGAGTSSRYRAYGFSVRCLRD